MVVIKKAHLVLLISILSLSIPAQAQPSWLWGGFSSFFSQITGFFRFCSDTVQFATAKLITEIAEETETKTKKYADEQKLVVEKDVASLNNKVEELEKLLEKQKEKTKQLKEKLEQLPKKVEEAQELSLEKIKEFNQLYGLFTVIDKNFKNKLQN